MSLHHQDWMKILGGLGGAATAFFAPELLPALFGSGAAAGGSTAAGMAAAGAPSALATMSGIGGAEAGAGLGAGFSSLVAPAMASQGLGMAASGAMGTPKQTMMQPQGVPAMMSQSDPFDILRQIKAMKGGGF